MRTEATDTPNRRTSRDEAPRKGRASRVQDTGPPPALRGAHAEPTRIIEQV